MVGIPNFPIMPVNFLSDVIERTYRNRVKTGHKRNDIIDICIEEMNKHAKNPDYKEFRYTHIISCF